MSDSLRFNKIAGAVLATGLAIIFMNQITENIFEPPVLTKPGYKIDIPLPGEGEAPAVIMPSPDWGTVLPAADLAAGAQIFVKCGSCHNATDENKTGPGLLGVLGRQPGTHPDFKYSDAMLKFGQTNPAWTYDLVEKFITKPQSFIDGTKMTFPGLKQQQDRINVIAYLHSLAPSLPIPKPDPARAAATAAALAPKGAAPAAGAAPAPGAAAPASAAAAAGAPVKGAAATTAAPAAGSAALGAGNPAAPKPAATSPGK